MPLDCFFKHATELLANFKTYGCTPMPQPTHESVEKYLNSSNFTCIKPIRGKNITLD